MTTTFTPLFKFLETCTIQRTTKTRNTASGERENVWDTITPLTAVACSYSEKTESRLVNEQPVTFKTTLLLIPPGQTVGGFDVEAGLNRIVDVAFLDGSTKAGPFRITAVNDRRDHNRNLLYQALSLEEQRMEEKA